MNNSNQSMIPQPNKLELEALAFRILREMDALQGKLNSVKQVLAQMESNDFLEGLKKGQAPAQPAVDMPGVTDAPVPAEPESIHAEGVAETVDTKTE